MHATASTGSKVTLRDAAGAATYSLNIGLATRAAQGKINEDFCGVAVPQEAETWRRGVVVALADGVSANGAGRIAAEATGRSLLTDYFSASAEWSTAMTVERLLRTTNDWLYSQNRAGTGTHGILATVSALIFTGNEFFVAHVGDTRIYRARGAAFEPLTADHTWPGRDMRRVLKRAVGLDTHLVVDFEGGLCAADDAFILVSDGVWDTLGERKMRTVVADFDDPQRAADALVDAACELQASYLGRNDASAIVIAVEQPA